MKPRERVITTCQCGRTYDRGAEMEGHCPDCLYVHYSEYFQHDLYEDRSKVTQNIIKGLVYGLLLLTISFPALALEVNLDAIKTVESAGCADPCIGDGGRAFGPYQLHSGAVMDASGYLKKRYVHEDALDPETARVLADAYINHVIPMYLKHYWLKDTLENRLTAYNMGIKAVRKKQIATDYVRKYKEAL